MCYPRIKLQRSFSLALLLGMIYAVQAGAAPLTVAVSDFTVADESYTNQQWAVGLSDLVQAKLSPDTEFVLVERARLKAAEAELSLSAGGFISGATALRIGKWVKADLLVLGHIRQEEAKPWSLHLEIVDLQRADVLVEREAQDVAGAAQALADGLREARRKLKELESQTVVAPLFFSNTDKSRRLDYLGHELQTEMVSALTTTRVARAIQFPRAQESIEEAELILCRLVECDLDAWQKVADIYVWGQYEEAAVTNTPFEQTPVLFTLNLWNGQGEIQTFRETNTVADLNLMKQRLIAKITTAARDYRRAPASDQARKIVAQQLWKYNGDIQQFFNGAPSAFESPQGQALWMLQKNVLATARFFDPGDYAIRRDWLIKRWKGTRYDIYVNAWQHGKALPLSMRWERAGDFLAFIECFGCLTPGDNKTRGKIDDEVLSLLNYAMADVRLIQPPDGMDPARFLERRNALLNRYGQLLLRLRQDVDKASESTHHLFGYPSPIYQSFGGRYHTFAPVFAIPDTKLRAEVIKAIWPLLMKEARDYVDHMIRFMSPISTQEWRYLSLTNCIPSVVEVFTAAGQPEKGQALVQNINAWAQDIKTQYMQKASQASALKITLSKETAVTPVKDRSAVSGNTQTNGPYLPPLPPALNPAMRFVSFNNTNVQGIVTLCAYSNGLWISGFSRPDAPGAYDGIIRTPRDYIVRMPSETVASIWSYRPELQVPTGLTGLPSIVTAFCPDGSNIWMTLAYDGVWRVPLNKYPVQCFGEQDGLATPRMFSAACAGRKLAFAGGEPNNGLINLYDPETEKWQRVNFSEEITQILYLGAYENWLIVSARNPDNFYYRYLFLRKDTTPDWKPPDATHNQLHNCDNLGSIQRVLMINSKTGEQRDIRGTLFQDSPRRLIGQNSIMEDSVVLASVADTNGIWLGTTVGLIFLDPKTGEQRNWFTYPEGFSAWYSYETGWKSAAETYTNYSRLRGSITALANDGEFLWVATSTRFFMYSYKNIPGGWRFGEWDAVYLLHKPSRKWVGYMEMPTHVTALAVMPGKLWIGFEDCRFGKPRESTEDFFAQYSNYKRMPTPLVECDARALLTIPASQWVNDDVPEKDRMHDPRPDKLSDTMRFFVEHLTRNTNSPDLRSQMETWKAKADQGDKEFQYAYASACLNGRYNYDNGSDLSPLDRVRTSKAIIYMRKAAEQGFSQAQRTLGELYEKGYCDLPQNTSEAKKWYALAARQGDSHAGECLKMLVDWQAIEPQANVGNAAAQRDYGLKCLRRYDLNRKEVNELNQARYWLRKAAEQDDREAQRTLGELYEKGRGQDMPPDAVKASYWRQRAAQGI